MTFRLNYSNVYKTKIWQYDPEVEKSQFTGEHHPEMTNEDVEKIHWYRQNLEIFPRGIGQVFPRLKCLTLIYCGLKKIVRNDLIGLKNLEELNLSSNKIESLSSDLFVGLHQLKVVVFSENKLKFLSSKLLRPIIGNGLTCVKFCNDYDHPVLYNPEEEEGVKTLQELMDLIDKNFEAPPDIDDLPDFAGAFENLLISGEFSDFTIIGGGGDKGPLKEFPVHKIIIGFQSSVLAAAFQIEMKEKQNGNMKIDDFTAETVEELLQFMYTGQLKNEDNAMDLHAIGNKYDVVKLKAKTEIIILCNIDESNAIEVFGLAHLTNSDEMKRAAFEVIQKMFPNYELKDELMEKPEDLKEIVAACHQRKQTLEVAENERKRKMEKAENERKRKMEEAEEEFESKMKKFA